MTIDSSKLSCNVHTFRMLYLVVLRIVKPGMWNIFTEKVDTEEAVVNLSIVVSRK